MRAEFLHDLCESGAARDRLADLLPADLDTLGRSFITPAMAEAAGLYRVDGEEGARLVGRRPDQFHDYAGVVFPYRWPGNPNVREYRLRRDHPDEELQPDGQIKERAKYLSPPGRKSMLYFAPDADPRWLDDPSQPIVFVEGEKKTLAMARLARESMNGNGRPSFLPVGIAGCWNWKGANKTETPDGRWRRVGGPIPDLERIKWEGRRVVILLDSNVHTDESVRAARDQFAYYLRGWGARVELATLPLENGLNGPDDFLAAEDFGAGFVLALIASALQACDDEAETAGEWFSLRDWAAMDDIASLLFSVWGFDDEDRQTWAAYNSVWGGRRTRTFRVMQLTIARRLHRVSPFDELDSNARRRAERFARDRIKKLRRAIDERLTLPLLEVVEPGGRVNPETGKRQATKYRICHIPFLEARRRAEEILRLRMTTNPSRAREMAAREIGPRFLRPQAEVEEKRRERKERLPDDVAALQVKFEHLIQTRSRRIAEKMEDEGAARSEIYVYFKQVGTRVMDYAEKILEAVKRKAKAAQAVAGEFSECMDTSERTLPINSRWGTKSADDEPSLPPLLRLAREVP